VVLPHGGEVRSVAVLGEGRLASGGRDGKIKLWPTDGTGELVVLSHGSAVTSLATRNADLSSMGLTSMILGSGSSISR
jgi:WD40 repeat protein